jgi:hypothetical protein
VALGGNERSDKRVSELVFYLNLLMIDRAILESAGFGFESRGARAKGQLRVAKATGGSTIETRERHLATHPTERRGRNFITNSPQDRGKRT